MSNNTKYVRDAFKSLELVEDKEFDLFGKDSFEELGDFIDTDDDVEVEQEVIDLDANEPEELKDSYVGDVILSCPVCHANMFKAVDDVVIDEETELCCVGDPCPVCGQEDGFKVIGKVAPFEEVEEEEETEVEVETEPEEAEAEVEVKEKVRESFKKRVADKRLQEKRIPAHRKLMEKVCEDCGKEVCECDKEEKPAKKPIRIKATGNMVEIPIEKKDRPLKEEKGDLNKLDKDIQDIVGDHFGYTMNFDFLDIVADVLLRIDDFEEAVDNDGIVLDTVDDTLIYTDDQWEVLRYYFDSPEDLDSESWDTAFTNFASDIEEICRKVAAQRGGEEVTESKKLEGNKKLSESKYQIKEVSSDEAGDIINNRKPLGLFLQKDGNTFVAIDNSTGDAWTEEFKNRRSAEKWLLSADESLKNPTKSKALTEETLNELDTTGAARVIKRNSTSGIDNSGALGPKFDGVYQHDVNAAGKAFNNYWKSRIKKWIVVKDKTRKTNKDCYRMKFVVDIDGKLCILTNDVVTPSDRLWSTDKYIPLENLKDKGIRIVADNIRTYDDVWNKAQELGAKDHLPVYSWWGELKGPIPKKKEESFPTRKLSEEVSDYAKEDIKREIERIVDEYFKGTDFFVSVSNIDFDAGKVTLDISALGGYDEDSDEVEELNREVEFDIPNLDLEDYFAAQLEDWMNTHNSPDNFYESKRPVKESAEDTLTWEDLRNNEFVYSLGDLDNEWKYIKFFEGSNDIYEDDVPEGEDPDDYSLVYYEIYDGDKQEVDGGEMIAPLSKTFVTKDLIKDLLELSGLTIEDDSEFTVTKMDSDFLDEALKSSKNKKLTEAPIYDLHPQFDSRKSFYSKAKVDTGYKGDKNKLYSYGTLVAELKDGKPVVYGTFSSTTLRHIKDWLKQLGFKADNAKQIMADYGVKDENRSVRRPGRKVNESLEDIKSEWENMRSRNMFEFPSGDYVYVGIDFDKKTIYAGGATNTGIFRETEIDLDEDDSLYGNLERLYDTISEEHPEYFETDESLKSDGKPLTESGKEQITVKWGDVFNERQQGRLAALKGQKIDRGTAEKISNAVASHLAKKNLDLKDLMPKIDFDNETFICNVEKEKEMSLGEDIEKATIETEDQVIKVSSEPKEENMNADWFDHDGGELLPDDQDEEMIAPLDDEDIQEIEDAQQPEEEPEENAEEPTETEEENPEDEEEFEFDEIQEESFKRITESYLKKVYSNVRSFKINNIDVNENLLRIDGTIRFNSGKKKDTAFVFESAKNKDTIAKTKKRFVGLNETFTDKKDAFVLNTVVNNKKFIAESLSYDYPAKTKDLNESVKTVKGIVK